MTIDVSTILKELGGKIDINGDVEMSDTDFLGEMYHFNEPVKVSGSVSNNGKSLILKANCTGHMTTQCARCMKDIVVDIDFDIDENLAQDDGSVSSDDDVILFEDVKIDIDDIVANNFLMNVEGKYLCSVSNNGKSLILKANCTGHMTTQCARCMKDIVVDIDFDIDENLAQDDGSVSSDDDVILFEDVKIDIDDIVANNFLMNVEGKYLCSEDCKGLCQHCGADLNEGDCGCSQENIDPRWAALVDIMEKDK